jgi:hypothetical protein
MRCSYALLWRLPLLLLHLPSIFACPSSPVLFCPLAFPGKMPFRTLTALAQRPSLSSTSHACSPPPPPVCSCRARITKLERIPAEAGLYISPLTLQASACSVLSFICWPGLALVMRFISTWLHCQTGATPAAVNNMCSRHYCRRTERKLTLPRRHESWMRSCARSSLRRLAAAVLLRCQACCHSRPFRAGSHHRLPGRRRQGTAAAGTAVPQQQRR